MNRFILKKYFIIFILIIQNRLLSLPPINLLRPEDRPLFPETWNCTGLQFSIGYEYLFDIKGFKNIYNRYDINFSGSKEEKVNPLQIYQYTQNAISSLNGILDYKSEEAQIAQFYNIADNNGTIGIYKPYGKFQVPVNLMFALRYHFNYGLALGVFLPYYEMELKDIMFENISNNTSLQYYYQKDLIDFVASTSGISLKPWKRKGIGDLVSYLSWTLDFPQSKPLLSNVRTNLRFGASFPTGKKTDENKILAIPFGNDGCYGLVGGGGIDLDFLYKTRAGVDIYLLYIFGNLKERRVKTAAAQTDLLFSKKVPTFKEFGLFQEYNLYLEAFNINDTGFSFKINYQYLKQNDDKIYISDISINPKIANDAENIQEWSTHSLLFMPSFDWGCYNPESRFIPSVIGWFKWGFNGKRALVGDSFGLMIHIGF
jgi:hypothetical protein